MDKLQPEEIVKIYYPQGFLKQFRFLMSRDVVLGEIYPPDEDDPKTYAHILKFPILSNKRTCGMYKIFYDRVGVFAVAYEGLHPLAREGEKEIKITLTYSQHLFSRDGMRRGDEYKNIVFPGFNPEPAPGLNL